MNLPTCVLTLNDRREIVAGSTTHLADAIRRGADLLIGTDFRHNEHIDPEGSNSEIVREVSDFRTTYLIDNLWVAGVMTLRMPVVACEGFGPRPSMSFFLYNQNGQQAIARPFLDGQTSSADAHVAPGEDRERYVKTHLLSECDTGTNAPSQNFIYDFEEYRYLVRDHWQEVYAHADDGRTTSGSLDTLYDAFVEGAEVKVAIRGLCNDLCDDPEAALDHEQIVHCGPGYFETESKRFAAGTQPTVRIRPATPMRYESRAWDFGWLLPRTDGVVFRWLCDPWTLSFQKSQRRHAIRWLVR